MKSMGEGQWRGGIDRTGPPPSATSPPCGARTPLKSLRRVVFPDPFGPMTPTNSPGATATDSLSNSAPLAPW